MKGKHQSSSTDQCSESSSSSSSSSCESSCDKPCCPVDKCDYYSPYEICCKFGPAVVTIESHLCLTAVPPQGVAPTPDDIRTYVVRGSGSMIGKGLILTSSFLAAVPPTALVNNYRYPYLSPAQTLGQVPADVVQFSRILVTVHNLNGASRPEKKKFDGHSVVYEASVVMIDGAGGTAVLRIDNCREFNRCRPPIKDCHPTLCIGQSRKIRCGDIAYLLGEISSDHLFPSIGSYRGVTEGVFVNTQTGMPNGWLLPELVAVSCNVSGSVVGAPILNKFGQIVAVQTTTMADAQLQLLGATAPTSFNDLQLDVKSQQGAQIVLGVAEYFFRAPLKAVLEVCKRGRKGDRMRQHLASVQDYSVGDFYRYVKGYAGVAYQIASGSDLVTYYRDPLSPYIARNELLNPDGTLYLGPKCGYISGVRVLSTAGSVAVSAVQVPGATSVLPYDASDLQDSNFISTLLVDSIITHVNSCCVGAKYPHIVPALQTWQYLPGESVVFTVRRPQQTGGVAGPNNLGDPVSVQGRLLDTPAVMDYLWSLVGQFPNLNSISNPAPAPVTPNNPMIPAVTFYPAF